MNTLELLKPDRNVVVRRRVLHDHCFHDQPAENRLERKCCLCAREEFSELQVAGHGRYVIETGDQTKIWSEWKKIHKPIRLPRLGTAIVSSLVFFMAGLLLLPFERLNDPSAKLLTQQCIGIGLWFIGNVIAAVRAVELLDTHHQDSYYVSQY